MRGGENVLAFTAMQVIPPEAPVIHMRTLRRREDTCSAFGSSIHSPTRHQRAAEGRISQSLWIQLGPVLSQVKDRKRQACPGASMLPPPKPGTAPASQARSLAATTSYTSHPTTSSASKHSPEPIHSCPASPPLPEPKPPLLLARKT